MNATEARRLFPLADRAIFMNHAGVSPMSSRARAAVEAVAAALTEHPYPDGWSRSEADRVRALLARLIGAPDETVGFTRGTAHGVSLLAQGLDWHFGDNVVSAAGEYPANVYPWMALAGRGVELRQAPCVHGRVTPEAVLELVDERTRVLALSHVEFWNGYRADLRALGAECRARGVVLAVDAIQSAGALEVDVEAMNVDFLAAGAYKWLMGPQGIGFCYCRPGLLEQLRPVLVGVGSMKRHKEYFEYDFDLAPGARRFEESSLSVLDLAAFGAAVELLLEVGLREVERRVLELSDRLARGLDEAGLELLEPWPRAAAESSGIVSFRRRGSSAEETLERLTAAGVVARVHSDFVRLSPHFYNTEEEVDRVLEILATDRSFVR